MKRIDRLNRFRKIRIAGAYVSVFTVVMISWTALYYVAAYVTDGMNRDEMRAELLSDLGQAAQLLDAADAGTGIGRSETSVDKSNANQAAIDGESDGGGNAQQSEQVERAARVLRAYAEQNGVALAMQQPGGEWIAFGEGTEHLGEWMGIGQSAVSGGQLVWSPSSEGELYTYQWANPFHARTAALMADVQGEDGGIYRFAIGKPLQAWNSHYVFALAPQLLFMLLLMVISVLAAPWQQQMKVLQMMVDAMKRISEGDFTVAISPHKRMGEMTIIAEELSDMASGLKELEETRQRFISDVSHELQSPLTSIAGFARALHNDALPVETRRDYLGMIEAESMRLSKLSDSLLKLTMLEARRGLTDTELTAFALDLQLKRTALAVEPLWLAKKLELDIEVAPVTINGDEDALRQVWTNLLHNAVKFTPEHGTIRVELKQVQEEAVVVIADSGIGINADDLSHVFERFYKADKARTSAKGGSGLGLSIAATIVRQHQGTITADSKPGEGTTFTVRLPLKPTAVPTSTEQEHKPKRGLQYWHDQHREQIRQRRQEHRMRRRGKE